MVRRYKLRDEDYAPIGDLLPKNGRREGRWMCYRTMLNGIFWILYTRALS